MEFFSVQGYEILQDPDHKDQLAPELFPALFEDDNNMIEQWQGADIDLDDEQNEQYFPLDDEPHDKSLNVGDPADLIPGVLVSPMPTETAAPVIKPNGEDAMNSTIHTDILQLHHHH